MLNLVNCVFLLTISSCFAAVTLKVKGLKVEVSNDLVKFNFKNDATISSLYIQDENIISGASTSFYLDWTGADGEIKFHPSNITIVEQTESRAHFFWVQDSSLTKTAFRIELHYVLEDGLSGIYSYAKYINDKNTNVTIAEIRIVYRFNPNLLTRATNQVRTGTLPTERDIQTCKIVQDATFEFPNGTYYTKYDYAVYIRETNYQGIFGNGYGAFVISPSREYHGGGPLKQDLTVHQYSLVTNYFQSAHFGCPNLNAPPGWTHLYGPFLIYFPTGNNEQIIASVQNQVDIEKNKWPYKFVKDNEFPIERGRIIGTVEGQRNATIAAYDSLDESVYDQQLGYLYSTSTDSKGYYDIEGIRPGRYKIVAYPLAGQGSENQEEKEINITAGNISQVNFILPEPENILWSLGEANRRANEFKYSEQARNYKWKLQTPTTNNFTIGKNDPNTDWYYAQSKPGVWNIIYQDKMDGNPRTLRLPFAAANKSILVVNINQQPIIELNLDNDGSIYRSALQSGRYRSNILRISPEHVVDGENMISLNVRSGGIMYDVISLEIKKK